MGRRKKKSHDLPRHMTFKHNSYYFRHPESKKWINLGKERAKAFLQYVSMTSPSAIVYLCDLINAYLIEVTPSKATDSQRNDKQSAAKLIEAFQSFTVEDVEPHHIYAYMDKRKETSAHWANKDRSFLLQCFKLAIKKGLINNNPCKQVSTISIKPRKRLIKKAEFDNFKSISSDFIKNMADFAYSTKLRRGEILTIKISDITEDGILAHDHKNDKDYIIEWTDSLRAIVSRIKAYNANNRISSLYLFSTKTGQPYSGTGFASIWRRAMDKALEKGLVTERFTFHDIRAMSITYTAEKHGLQAASESAGHADTKITKRVYIRGAQKRKPTE